MSVYVFQHFPLGKIIKCLQKKKEKKSVQKIQQGLINKDLSGVRGWTCRGQGFDLSGSAVGLVGVSGWTCLGQGFDLSGSGV